MYFPSLYFWLISKACSWWGGSVECGTTQSPPGPPTSCVTPALKVPQPSPPHWGLEGRRDCRFGRAPLPCTYIFPAQCGFAALTENISYRVEPREQKALFCRPTTHVDPVSRNRRDPAPSGVALSVQPPNSPKELPSGELNPPSWEPLPSATCPFKTSAWAFLQQGIPVLPRLPTRELQPELLNPFARGDAKQRCEATFWWLTFFVHRGT